MVQNSQNTESIFDYIYLDDEKIAFLSSQVFDHGLLTGSSVTNGTSTSGSVTTTPKLNASGEVVIDKSLLSILLGGAKANAGSSISFDIANQNSANSGLLHSYDTKFLAAKNLLNKLDEKNYITKDLNNLKPCSLALIKGSIHVLDLNLFEDLMFPHSDYLTSQFNIIEKEHLANIKILKQSITVLKKQKNTSEVAKLENEIHELSVKYDSYKESTTELKKNKEVVKYLLPMSRDLMRLQMIAEGKVFSSVIKPDNFKVNTISHYIKAGEQIQGEAYCLAIIERLPVEEDIESVPDEKMSSNLEYSLSELRSLLEIKTSDYAITPIMIFRKII